MIKVAIVGAGGMAKAHARDFSRFKDVQIVACCDVLEDKAKEFAEEYKLKAYYSNYKTMLKEQTLDAIVIASVDTTHAEISIAALNKKIAVLCEKPMATSLTDAKKMLAAAKKANVLNMVNFTKRDAPVVQWAKEYVEKGGIGRVIHVDAQYLQSWIATADWYSKDGWLRTWIWRLSTRHGSLGSLGDLGCHIIDMACYICGDITEMTCDTKTFKKNRTKNERLDEYIFDAHDSFVASVTFKSGAFGSIQSTRWSTGYRNREFLAVYGDKGSFEIDFTKGKNVIHLYNNELEVWETRACPKHPSNVERFVDALRKGKKTDECDFANGLKIQTYIDVGLKSATKKHATKIKF